MNKIFTGLFLSFLLFSCKESKEQTTVVEPEVEVVDTLTTNVSAEVVAAPAFNLEFIDGGTKSLADYKGKLVFIDIWATWCGPCLAQIPFMKILEEKYKNEPIEFVSISLDTEKDKEKWRNMVKEKQMGGDHLYAGTTSDFAMDYKVNFIPRFILISPDGNILMDNTPQVMNADGDAVNEEIIQIFDYSLEQIKKASQ